ncbi:hypothetical protein OG984_06465 [Nocardioides sp. NBC_00368]|uniref:hypothetical protein n=1 Tax=Nocardioides sp. NBC_00368 TaxID=2976000 RepID=UPI002E201F3D
MSATPLGTRTLKIKFGAEEYSADVSAVTLNSAESESDFVSFADAAAGGARQYSVAFTATQDPADATSIWNMVWLNAGDTVAVEIAPYGGATASAANPIIRGNVVISEPDGALLGGEANASVSARFTFDLEWVFTAKPELVTTAV